MRLFFSSGCPYAQRSRALLTHLEQSFEPREIDLANKPADFLAISPSGKVPLLEDDGFLLYESAVVNEYLAERFGWSGFSTDVQERARERLAIVQFDGVLNPTFFKLFKNPGTPLEPNVVRELEQLAKTVRNKPVESLLGLHIAPFWIRWTWVDPDSELVKRVRAEPGLAEWLDRAAALPAITATNPDRDETVRMMRERFGPSKE